MAAQMSLHDSITEARVCELAELAFFDTEDVGICAACGEDAYGVEMDARKYTCEACGAEAVYGMEFYLLQFS